MGRSGHNAGGDRPSSDPRGELLLGIRTMTIDDFPVGLRLKEQAGWNQLADDWLRLLDLQPADVLSTGLPEPRSDEGLDAAIALDREVCGTDRGRLIGRLAREHRASFRVVEAGDRVAGYLMSRPGSTARQIGPCIADEQ